MWEAQRQYGNGLIGGDSNGRKGKEREREIQKSQSHRKGNKFVPYAKNYVSVKMHGPETCPSTGGVQSTGAGDQWCVHTVPLSDSVSLFTLEITWQKPPSAGSAANTSKPVA